MQDIISFQNKYLQVYFENYIKVFRRYCKDKFSIDITGLGNFISPNNTELSKLLDLLNIQGFTIQFVDDNDTIECLRITITNIGTGKSNQLDCNIDNLLSIIELSSKTNISTYGIIILKIISRLICQTKILYKAIVLDLDDTIWNGTLAEVGIQAIKSNLQSKEGTPYIGFMNFIRTLAEELGIYVAICSKNSQELINKAIESYDEDVFPLKGQIDCIIANFSDKSLNIQSIAQQLSIMPNSIVFIDDNPIVRDEVKKNLPEVFVPEWNNHDELITLLKTSCVFDRFELSIKSKNRRRQFKILQQEKVSNTLPKLYIRVNTDPNHKEATKLYSKSNQFKLVSEPIDYIKGVKSIYFELFRANGENLGICSAITYSELKNSCGILNWAISCRYFGIGLEEFILLYLLNEMPNNDIHFVYQFNPTNSKVDELINKYYGEIICDSCDSVPADCDIAINHFNYDYNFKDLLLKLRKNKSHFNMYWLGSGCLAAGKTLLEKNTNLEWLKS